jgi:hypothetical protein
MVAESNSDIRIAEAYESTVQQIYVILSSRIILYKIHFVCYV